VSRAEAKVAKEQLWVDPLVGPTRPRGRCIPVGLGAARELRQRADAPRLDVRLPGLEQRSPQRWVLTRGTAPAGWTALPEPEAIIGQGPAQSLFVEGGAGAAAAFLAADLVDRLLLYRAPIVIGGGRPGIADVSLTSLAAAHGRWQQVDRRTLGSDTLEVYERIRTT